MRFFLHKSLTGKAINCFGVIVAKRDLSGVLRTKCAENKLDLQIVANDDRRLAAPIFNSCGLGMKNSSSVVLV
jgi:hypothetical protein